MDVEDESSVHAAVRRARLERQRARGEVDTDYTYTTTRPYRGGHLGGDFHGASGAASPLGTLAGSGACGGGCSSRGGWAEARGFSTEDDYYYRDGAGARACGDDYSSRSRSTEPYSRRAYGSPSVSAGTSGVCGSAGVTCSPLGTAPLNVTVAKHEAQIGALRAEQAEARREAGDQASAASERMEAVEQRLHDVEATCRDALGRCAEELAALSQAVQGGAGGALATRQPRLVSAAGRPVLRDAPLRPAMVTRVAACGASASSPCQPPPHQLEGHDLLRHAQPRCADRPLPPTRECTAAPPPRHSAVASPPLRSSAQRLLGAVPGSGGGGDVGEEGCDGGGGYGGGGSYAASLAVSGAPLPPPPDADARALLRGFARGRVVWYNDWRKDLSWFVRSNSPAVAVWRLHPCSPFTRRQFALIIAAKFGFLSWLVYNGISGRAVGVWINESVSPWSDFAGPWPDGRTPGEQLDMVNALFTADRTQVALFLGATLAIIYQRVLVYLAVPPRCAPTRPELFLVMALGGVACFGVMCAEADADGANGFVVLLLLLFAEVVAHVAALVVDFIEFQVLSFLQMQMLLRRATRKERRVDKAAGAAGGGGGVAGGSYVAEPSGSSPAAMVGSEGGVGGASVSGAGASSDEDDGGDDGEAAETVEPLAGPDRAHPVARCGDITSLYARAYPYGLRHPTTAFLDLSWTKGVPQVAREEALARVTVVPGRPPSPQRPSFFGFGAKTPGVTPGARPRGAPEQTPAERAAQWYLERAAKQKAKQDKVRQAEDAFR